MKSFHQKILFALCVLTVIASLFACGSGGRDQKSSPSAAGRDAPLDTLKTYNEAIKKGDAGQMKSLLSKASLKMAEDEARAQNVSVDEVIRRQTPYSPGQTTVKYRNQKIEGERASIEVENSFGSWDVIPFVREEGRWKIANEFYTEELLKQAEESDKRINEEINRAKQP